MQLCEDPRYATQIMKLLDPTQDLTEIVGLIYELFYMSAVVDETAVIALFKAFCGYQENEDEFEEKFVIPKEPIILDKCAQILASGNQKPEIVQKIVLIIERICRLNPSFCCSFFLSKPRGEPGDCLGELIGLLLESEDLGVQQSVYQILGTLFGRDATMNVAMSDGMNKQ